MESRDYCVGKQIIKDSFRPILINQKDVILILKKDNYYQVVTTRGWLPVESFYNKNLTFQQALDCLNREVIKLAENR